jgi:hypothetical protein
MNTAARLIAFYLPQFHPIPENDQWWGRGFTEWTNVGKARPLFSGHYQPRVPADLGYYDLRVPEVREAQAELARNAGIEGFCYYHYWFGGKRLLERPFTEVVRSGEPRFPFCLCWANQTWSGVWHGEPRRVLIEQTYPGREDWLKHFVSLREAFLDERYLRVDGRPLFVVYRPNEMPDVSCFIREWQELAIKAGLPGLHFVAHLFHEESTWDYQSRGFDSCVIVNHLRLFSTPTRQLLREIPRSNSCGSPARVGVNHYELYHGLVQEWVWRRFRESLGQFGNVRLYRHALPYLVEGCTKEADAHPCLCPNWDNTARSGVRGVVLHDSSPELWRSHVRDALAQVRSRPSSRRLVFIKSWNEWAEGNYLEPDQRFGHDYLNVVREEMTAVC